ncbi:MAG: aldehyde ferredoxin oxidoreductase family protein, partial [Myxococcota bacterium]|nr:aldehyde ferredoxin oxidoreductase family protein [Myxococcota bacterium]
MNGWMGRILKVDLGGRRVEPLDVGDDARRRYLGGRGLGVRLHADLCAPTVDPFSPENPLVFMTGPLTATRVPTCGRYQVVSRSPLTGTIFDSSSGGTFGAALKRTGIDGLVVTGAAGSPVYLLVTDEGIEFRDAGRLWGADTHVARDEIAAETGGKASVASIGPAGERRVPMAAIMNDKDRAAGRGGLGAVMGSKNLKAIAAAGSRQVGVADPDGLKAVLARVDRLLDKNAVTGKSLQILGTAVLVNLINEHGMFPTENFRRGVFNDAEGVSGEKIAETILTKRSACHACPIACGRATKTSKEEGEGPEYESVWAFSAHCGVNDLDAATHANYACNRLGLDTISTGGTIGCAMELSALGLLPEAVRWGDAARVVSLVEEIAYCRGLGAELAQGSRRLAERYGRPELAMQVKGLELPAYDPRGAQGQALAYATSNRGGCHMRAFLIAPEILGMPCFVDRFSTAGKADLAILLQDLSAAVDSTVLCRFLQFALGLDTFADLLARVTGMDCTPDELLSVGTRIYNLERLLNCRAGLERKDDLLPRRFLEERLDDGPSRDRVVRLDEMLDEYYRRRGWDADGRPTAETLRRLGQAQDALLVLDTPLLAWNEDPDLLMVRA